VGGKREGTQVYQELSRRCLASMVEVAPLRAVEADRPRLQGSVVQSLIATKRNS